MRQQGKGIGGQLLAAAALRCIQAAREVGGVILIIDAKSDRAVARYASYGALPLTDAPRTLVMSLATFEDELKVCGHL